MICSIIVVGGDLVSTWVAKLEVHAEDVITLVKNVTNQIIDNTKRQSAVDAANDVVFFDASEVVAKAA